MNVLKIVVALICCYGLFVSVSYLLMRLLFPKIEIEESAEELRRMRQRQLRRISRPLRKQKNLAF
jgi:flagellar biogenesis protein FliO